jgi:ferredoxin
MKLRISEDQCIGCGACQAVAPSLIEMDGVAKVITEDVPEEAQDEAREAIEACPVEAVYEAEAEEE